MPKRKLLKLVFAMNLLMISFAGTTNATDALIEGIQLTKGKPAPFTGVLVPQDMYRDMTVDIDLGYKYKQDYLDCTGDLTRTEFEADTSKAQTVWWLVGGILLGFMVGKSGG